MSQLYRDTGVVLRTHKLGEADRIVVILTRNHGKVRAVAKGVRKTSSRFGARLEPTTQVALQLYAGRELDVVTQAETVENFRAIREHLDRITRASAMLEAVEVVSPEREPNPRLYLMLVGALGALAANDPPLVVPAFFLKLLSLEGFHPVVDRCVNCGAEGPLVSFDVEGGGMRCAACRYGQAVSPEGLDLLQRVLGGQLGSALNEETSQATYELEQLATRLLEHHVERRIRSVTLFH